jgi:hypothetical protein
MSDVSSGSTSAPTVDLPTTELPTVELPTVDQINRWDRDGVKRFLQRRRTELEFEVNDIDIIYSKKVSGKAFLRLTEEQLTRVPGTFQLDYTPASAIADLVKQIKGGKRTSFSLTPCHIRQ